MRNFLYNEVSSVSDFAIARKGQPLSFYHLTEGERMSQVTRNPEIRRRRKRKATLRLLRGKLAQNPNNTLKQAILAKLHKVAPWINDREWLNPAHLQNQPAPEEKEKKTTTRRAA